MLFSKSLRAKGFVFVLELLIAFVLFLEIIQIASLEPIGQTDSSIIRNDNQILANALSIIDRNGFVLQVLDDNSLSESEKISQIYSKLDSLIPNNYDFRFELKAYSADANACRESSAKKFVDCFSSSSTYSLGNSAPSNTNVFHERIFLVKRDPPQQCTNLTRLDLKKANEKQNKLFFMELPKLFFAGLDQNLPFDINSSIAPNKSSFSCDEDIRVDMNIKVNDLNAAARNYVDMVLVFNDSNHMKGTTFHAKEFSPSTAQGGIGAGCNSPNGGWISLPSITFSNNYDKKNYKVLSAVMDYTNIGAGCAPRLRILKSPNSYNPNSNGATSSSPIIVTDTDFDQTATYTVQIWSDHLINYDVNLYLTKVYPTKAILIDFLQYSQWQKSGNDGDYIGVASYNGGIEQNLQVAQANADVSRIQNLTFETTSAPLGNGLHWANSTLVANDSQRPNAKNYQIIISDGYYTNGTYDYLTETNYARDHNITIYSVGVGFDVNDIVLKQIASITNGKYYAIEEFSQLGALISQLANDITNNAVGSGNQVLVGANLAIPAKNCAFYTDLNGGVCAQNGDSNYITYTIGDLNYGNSWTRHFVLNIPCTSTDSCKISQLTLMPLDTIINWLDSNLSPQNSDWNMHITVDFLYRDIKLDITKYSMTSDNEIFLDVNTLNNGLLSLPTNPIVEFFLETVGGEILTPAQTITDITSPGSYHLIFDKRIDKEGKIIAIINRNYPIRECPGNNAESVTCLSAPQTKYYLLDVWGWKR